VTLAWKRYAKRSRALKRRSEGYAGCEGCGKSIHPDAPRYVWADVETCKDCGGAAPEHRLWNPVTGEHEAEATA
jgi:hypothetical protein